MLAVQIRSLRCNLTLSRCLPRFRRSKSDTDADADRTKRSRVGESKKAQTSVFFLEKIVDCGKAFNGLAHLQPRVKIDQVVAGKPRLRISVVTAFDHSAGIGIPGARG
jgi:hypothetical protein